MHKRILVNAVAIRRGKEGGASHYVEQLASVLPLVCDDLEFWFLLHPSFDVDLPPGIRRIDISATDAIARLYCDNYLVPRLAARLRASAIVALLGFGPIKSPIPQVVSCTDATYFTGFGNYGRSGLESATLAARRAIHVGVLKRAADIISPSASLAVEIQNRLGPQSRVHVLPFGWDTDFRAPQAVDPQQHLDILYVSQLQPHKAHIHLGPFAAALRDLGIAFTITICIEESDSPRLYEALRSAIKERDLEQYFSIRGHVSARELQQLYSRSHLFAFPSLCESFGFPMIEAVAAGLLVVAADTPINREILGDSALYFPPMAPARGALLLADLLGAPDADTLIRRRVLGQQRHMSQLLPSWKEYAVRFCAVVREAAMRAG